jgi:hypothetical protein
MVHCRPHTSAVKTGLLSAAQFSNENYFAAGTLILATNATSLQLTRFWQRMLIHCSQLDFGSESRFRCRQHNFGSEC